MSGVNLAEWLAGRFPASGAYIREAQLEDGDCVVRLALSAPAPLTDRWAAALREEWGASARFLQPDAEALEQQEKDFLDRQREKAAQDRKRAADAPKKTKKKPPEALYGRSFSGKPQPMDSLPNEEAEVCVQGEVFYVERRETRGGDTVLLIDLTDRRASVRMRLFLRRDAANSPILGVKPKQTLRVKGRLEWDKFSRESSLQLTPDGIIAAERAIRQDTAEQKRVELHLHTSMSEMDAVSSADALIERAAKWGHRAVAVTDHGVLHSFPAAMNAGAKYGIKVLYGCEAYFVDDVDPIERERAERQKPRGHHMLLLARSAEGLRNLYRLTSEAHLHNFYHRPRIFRSALDAAREGLLVGSACSSGMLFKALLDGSPRARLLEIARYYDFLEVQPIGNNGYMLRNGQAQDAEALRAFNRVIVGLAEELGIPAAATGDVHFLDPEDEIFRTVLLAEKEMADADTPLYLKSTQEMLEEFAYLGKDKAFEVVVTAPNGLADLCGDIQPVRSGEFFPKLPDSDAELRRLCAEKTAELYGENPPELLTERLHKELESIIGKGYDIIYMAAQKLVRRSLERGYLVGSRGSVGSSIAAYLSGVTEVNALPPHYRCPNCRYWEFPGENAASCGADMPDKPCPRCGGALLKDGFDIPFATFLGFEADKKPDIDLNFSGEYQAEAHRHTVELFGDDKVFRAGTISGVQEKTAMGFVLGYMDKRKLELPYVEQRRLALGCGGVKRTTGQHPGGVIIVPREMEIYDFCPVQHPADKSDSGIVTTHFDYHAIEENLLKLDLLGHDDPSMIRMLENLTGVDARAIPLDDADTMSLFTDSAALGYENDPILGLTGACAVPEFGTRFVREMLIATHPTTFDELVRISGLSHGTDVWRGNAEDLIRSGMATLKEVICARDDIMIYLIAKGVERKTAFTIMESVRKGKGLTSQWENEMRACGVPDWYIQSCKKIKYMFPKAHAVAYVIMAFRIAWFKVRHPLAFYAAFFTIRAVGFDAAMMAQGLERCSREMAALRRKDSRTPREDDLLVTLEVVYEFYRRGLQFAPISLYESDGAVFTITGDKLLRPPLTALPGLGATAAEAIVKAREGGRFQAVEEIHSRCGGKVTSAHVESLREIGALDGLPDSLQLSLFDV
jgi:DNA polymerase-3 subunit alpha (Gram-positive type)